MKVKIKIKNKLENRVNMKELKIKKYFNIFLNKKIF
jgi:hypothetical protein